MSPQRLNQILDSAYKSNDTQLMRDTYNEWQIGNCYYPQRVLAYDAHTMTKRFIEVACGRCYHCMESKINEWCARMYAHAEDFKNVYFVTLTYRSITNPELAINKLLLSSLKQAVWHRDAFNSMHHLSFNPCLLVKDHYQRFLKRLRKNTGLSDITYVLSGEYGHDYGRPHFHLILFTNGILTKRDIVRAWSVCLWKDSNGMWTYRRNQRCNGVAYDFPLGRVDFNDLVSNGTFNTTAKIRVDGSYLNAGRCFAYVCKYVCKRDTANLNRVRLAYNSLFVKRQFVKIFDKEVQFNIVKSYLYSVGYSYQQINDTIPSLKRLSYEKIIFEPAASVLPIPEQTFSKTLFGVSVNLPYFPENFRDFRDSYLPFCEFSRGTPIGSVYATRNIHEFAQGVFTKPLLLDGSYVVPSYFRNKAKNYLYRLRKANRTLKGVSFNLGAMPDLYGRFSGYLQNGGRLYCHFDTQKRAVDYQRELLKPDSAFFDAHTRERILLVDNFAEYFKYNRSARKYVRTRVVPLAEWIRKCCSDMLEEFQRHSDALRISQENARLRERAKLLLTDSLGDFSSLRDNFVAGLDEERRNLQRVYHAGHQSVE